MTNTTINGRIYAELVRRGASGLLRRKREINDLNVFPIPDGDTGDNMYLTIKAGAGVSGCDSIADAARDISREMLYGARGNSGVILSRIFAGIAKGFDGKETVGIPEIKRAMRLGVSEAYSAVDTPVEGTMLTVLRDAVTAAEGCAEDASLDEYFGLLLSAMRSSLERTPDQLSVLKEAGVVDSGGAGLVAIAEGICGGDEPAADESRDADTLDYSLFTEDSVLEFGYCTEFLLRLQKSKVDLASFDEKVLFDWLSENGESVVAFREGSVIKVHIHTEDPGKILSHCRAYGEFLKVKIENMTLQHSEREKKQKKKPEKKLATVAVASGEGMKRMFEEIGVDAVISGGQSMNPSAEDFIKAFGEINAENILVFPNNSNVILAAEQASQLWNDARVTVIRSGSIGEGYIALSALDPSAGSIDEIVAAVYDEMSRVRAGMVSSATKDATLNGVPVKAGSFIGFTGHTVHSSGSTAVIAAESLCDGIGSTDCGLCIIVVGEGGNEADARKIAAYAESKFPVEVIVTDGGQPVYDYIIIFD